ncbi:hypothetical protein CXG81DRAFT_11347 [Caulochytrium protostelioides]|uniref:Endonuclease n=1 Tax=Caulochytrium protostelioides TaxID=1555241 RepID=A0A4P9X9E2_9FUNG|nr:hypothetical protein CXG81DRAFT_11347 [Caulochytrium protostelioides]|eukprot:RKP01957.1 hypothetical protein CXG81DRAFT_11347 [Caulochytrium protostelioides]
MKIDERLYKFGLPQTINDLLPREHHVVLYNRATRVPHWVLERMDLEHMDMADKELKRPPFRDDPAIPALFRADMGAYVKSGYDRGHLAAAANHRASGAATYDETFLMSNVAPQHPYLNRKAWRHFEAYVRDLVGLFDDVCCVTGPLYVPRPDQANGAAAAATTDLIGGIIVPTHFYKVVLCVKDDNIFLESFVFPNGPDQTHLHSASKANGKRSNSKTALEQYRCSITDLERAAGTVFFPKLNRRRVLPLCLHVPCQF